MGGEDKVKNYQSILLQHVPLPVEVFSGDPHLSLL
jgi:hypothetical protein